MVTLKLSSILIFFLLVSCSKTDTNPFGLESIGQSDRQSVRHVEIYGAEAELKLDFPVSLIGASDELLIGNYKGVTSGIVLKFEAVSSVISSGTVQDAFLILIPSGRVSSDSTGSYDVNAHNVTTAWSTEDVNPEAILNSFDPDTVGTTSFGKQALFEDTLQISTAIVQGWVDQSGPNNGVLLIAPNLEDMHIFFSDETIGGPRLQVNYIRNDSTLDATISDSDASSVLRLSPGFKLPEDRLAVASGLGITTFFKFDFPELPDNASINFASVTIHIDTSASIFPSASTEFVLSRMFATTTEWSNTADAIDSTQLGISRYANTLEFEMNISTMLQSQARDKKEDFGFRLSPFNPIQSIFRIVFFASSATDSSLMPKAEVFYTIPSAEGQD